MLLRGKPCVAVGAWCTSALVPGPGVFFFFFFFFSRRPPASLAHAATRVASGVSIVRSFLLCGQAWEDTSTRRMAMLPRVAF